MGRGVGVGVVNLLHLQCTVHYTMISPLKESSRKKKKNGSYFLSTPKLVYYVYLMALHEDALRP